MRFRLDIAYDGTGFHGWAAQPGLRTVRGTLEECMARLMRQQVPLTCAGRTDAGVHARGQVAHFDLPAGELPEAAPQFTYRLNRMLPDDVTVRACQRVSDDFDARFSALERTYVYRMCDAQEHFDPLRRHEVTLVRRPLDVEAMNAAAVFLTGEHDFAAFCKKRAGATTIRTLKELTSVRSAELIETTVRADAFCHSMVRSLMGALIAVGEHRFEPQWAEQVRIARIRDPRVKVMAANGLTLEHVAYPPEPELADRARSARRRRDEVTR